jgi:hypothetical protein
MLQVSESRFSNSAETSLALTGRRAIAFHLRLAELGRINAQMPSWFSTIKHEPILSTGTTILKGKEKPDDELRKGDGMITLPGKIICIHRTYWNFLSADVTEAELTQHSSLGSRCSCFSSSRFRPLLQLVVASFLLRRKVIGAETQKHDQRAE